MRVRTIRAGTVAGAHRRTSEAIHFGVGDFSPTDQRRRAQSNCAQSSPVEITFPVCPDAEGCYNELDTLTLEIPHNNPHVTRNLH